MNLTARVLIGIFVACGVLLGLAGIRGIAVLGPVRFRFPNRKPKDERPVIEALAVWTEQLRDTIAGASGLEQAISITARTAPPLLQPAVQALSVQIGFHSFPDAMREFAGEVDHPLADFVAAALITAAENQVRELASLLGHLAQCCRDDVAMRTRVWVARARSRSAVRIIGIVVVTFVLGLALLDPSYLAPYASPSGLLVAALVAAMFLSALASMRRLGQIETPARFIARRRVVES